MQRIAENAPRWPDMTLPPNTDPRHHVEVPTGQAARPMAGRALLTATAGVPPALRPVAAHRFPPPRPQRTGRRDGELGGAPLCPLPCSSLRPGNLLALMRL